MLRFTRPLRQVVKQTTGLVGLQVHPNPLPELKFTYEQTLQLVEKMPASAIYRQSVEALVRTKLNVVSGANGDVSAVEKQLDEGQIEESILIASDELNLAAKILEWKPWEPLEEKPAPGQWEYPQA